METALFRSIGDRLSWIMKGSRERGEATKSMERTKQKRKRSFFCFNFVCHYFPSNVEGIQLRRWLIVVKVITHLPPSTAYIGYSLLWVTSQLQAALSEWREFRNGKRDETMDCVDFTVNFYCFRHFGREIARFDATYSSWDSGSEIRKCFDFNVWCVEGVATISWQYFYKLVESQFRCTHFSLSLLIRMLCNDCVFLISSPISQ